MFVGKLDTLSSFGKPLHSDFALLGGIRFGVGYLSLKNVNLPFSSVRGSPVSEPRANSSSSGEGDEYKRPYLDAVRETRLRALIGVPLLLIGIWLIGYCDRAFNHYLGWRGWLLWFVACGCIVASFILLAYRDRLVTLRDLL